MTGLGTIVNVAAIIFGSATGLILRKVIAKRITDTVMQGVGLAVIIIGISGALVAAFSISGDVISTNHILFMIISLAVGGIIGELIKIEGRLEAFGDFCEKKLTTPGEESTFAQGFITATLVFCVGSMAIVGSLEDGINKNSDILFAKSMLDGISSMIFASTMGVGVIFSALTVGIYQGAITVLSVFLAPYLTDTVITQMSLIGSVLIMSIGFNMMKITKVKVGNLLPAMFIPLIFYAIQSFF